MTGSLSRQGLGYRYTPQGVGVYLTFSKVNDRSTEFQAEVAVFNVGMRDPVIIRQVNLKASLEGRAGSMGDLLRELKAMTKEQTVDWPEMLRDAARSVMISHRAGHPFEFIDAPLRRPPPPAWLCDGLVLKNKQNTWLGAASTGKSTLAKAICAYYACGYRFCDREMEQGKSLYLDWEDDFDSFQRVIHDVCRNLGAEPPKSWMAWRSMRGYRLRDQIETIGEFVQRQGTGLLVLDAVQAAGGAGGEHSRWEDIALEMDHSLGLLPTVTVLALDHVTAAEHKAGESAPVPIKARGSERKVEVLRNQWSLMTSDSAAKSGRHVVNWYQTKNSVGRKDQQGFSTEIVWREADISIVVGPRETDTTASDNEQKTLHLLRVLASTWRSPRELALQIDGKEPSRGRVESVRTLLDRAVSKGLATRDDGRPVRYTSCRQSDVDGVLIPFPGSA